jgi:hypothetical protein
MTQYKSKRLGTKATFTSPGVPDWRTQNYGVLGERERDRETETRDKILPFKGSEPTSSN